MRIPVFLQEHPVEAFLAGALLLGLLFGGADRSATEVSKGPQGPQIAIAQRL
jgi:hypothetical protein